MVTVALKETLLCGEKRIIQSCLYAYSIIITYYVHMYPLAFVKRVNKSQWRNNTCIFRMFILLAYRFLLPTQACDIYKKGVRIS